MLETSVTNLRNFFTANGTHITLEAGETLCRQGDPSDAIYLVVEGRLGVYAQDPESARLTLINYVGAGEILGELGTVTGHPRSATLIAEQRTDLLSVPTDVIRSLLFQNPALAQVLMATTRSHLISTDISRIQLEHTYRQTQQQVAVLGEEKEQLRALLQLREEMESMLVHDLKNPLNIIASAINLLEPMAAEVSDRSMFELLIDLMRNAAERMQHLIMTLLDIAKMEAGRMELKVQEFDLAEEMKRLLTSQQFAALLEDIQLVTEVPSPLPVRADREVLFRVLINLLDNAIKFTPEQGRVTIEAEVTDNVLHVSFTDSGPRIPAEERERIFERFIQGAEGMQRQRGTGLGLTFCRMAVEAHGGSIWVEPAPGEQGNRFHFQIPQQEGGTDEAEAS